VLGRVVCNVVTCQVRPDDLFLVRVYQGASQVTIDDEPVTGGRHPLEGAPAVGTQA
jgi:hypothetical protein